ncbi:MAG: hypothetical protein IT462_05870, partial [Planctomycetes bacterium]|nr:hypothetical protein [Planctomycetota bacterium]
MDYVIAKRANRCVMRAIERRFFFVGKESAVGGKSGGKRGQELIKTAVRVGQQTERQSLPSRALGFSQGAELLSTGGIGARLPLISKALESVRTGNATARTSLEGNLAANGLAGTPYGIAALNQADIA